MRTRRSAVVALVVLAVVAVVALSRWTSAREHKLLKTLLAELQPGMHPAAVRAAIPPAYWVSETPCTNALWLTTLKPGDAQVHSCVYYVRDPPWWQLGAPELAYLYFDAHGHLVGMKYSSSRYQFAPAW